MAAWSTEASDMFFALRANAKNQVRGKASALDTAAHQRKNIGGPLNTAKAIRDFALVGRGYVEIYRNGWEIDGESPAQFLNAADAAIQEALAFEDSPGADAPNNRDYYPLWKRGYVDRYCARSAAAPNGWSTTMQASLQSYQRALAARDVTPHARRSILVDQAETLVYMGAPDAGVAIIENVLTATYVKDRAWHIWAFAFALQQAGNPDRATDELEAVVDASDLQDLYNNDMRLMLAAAHQSAGNHTRAAELIQTFSQVRENLAERQWTLALEIERGAFEPGSSLEAAWQGTLADAGLT